jgi:hypothetical protein
MWTWRRMVGRCSVFCRTTKASAATGRPTKNVPRHPRGESTMTPPINGPLTVASAKTAPM